MTRMTRPPGTDPALPGIQRVSVTVVSREAARLLQEVARDRGVEVVIAPDLPEVNIDVGGLELLLMNLLSNAIKYSDPDKPRRFVEIAPAPMNGECAFQIRDNGLGMTPAQLQQLFTPFYRGHPERDAELGVEGLGLGLTIARDCAQAIGASITVDAALGEGTTFTVTLPHSGGPPRPAQSI
jgi:signal transduction histidine kinase